MSLIFITNIAGHRNIKLIQQENSKKDTAYILLEYFTSIYTLFMPQFENYIIPVSYG